MFYIFHVCDFSFLGRIVCTMRGGGWGHIHFWMKHSAHYVVIRKCSQVDYKAYKVFVLSSGCSLSPGDFFPLPSSFFSYCILTTLLCGKQHAKCFTYLSFFFYSSQLPSRVLLIPFYRWENEDSWWLRRVAKSNTKLLNGRTGVKLRSLWLQNL